MHLFSAGTTFNDVRIPFPHVRVAGSAARSTLDNLQREHPTATPIIVGGDGDSVHLLFDERLAFPPEELEEFIERSLQGDGWSLHLAYERELHDRMLPRLKELNAGEIIIRTLSEWPRLDQTVNPADVAKVINQPWPEPPHQSTDLSCPASWVHVAYAREWSARFGAHLLVLTHDTLEFEVARPITSREDAAVMAAVHAHYHDTSDVYPSAVVRAAYLLGARLWHFWWD